jgi:hypothetical protein
MRPGIYTQARLTRGDALLDGAAETRESVAQEGKRMREGWDSRRGSMRHRITLSAISTVVKYYKGGCGLFNDSAGPQRSRTFPLRRFDCRLTLCSNFRWDRGILLAGQQPMVLNPFQRGF